MLQFQADRVMRGFVDVFRWKHVSPLAMLFPRVSCFGSFWFFVQSRRAAMRALRQSTDPHSTSARGLSGVAPVQWAPQLRYFAFMGTPAQPDQDQFRFRRAAFYSSLKSK